MLKRPRSRSITTSICYPQEMASAFDEVGEDFGNLSEFVRICIAEYLRAKGAASSKNAAVMALGPALIQAQIKADEVQEAAIRSRKERNTRRLETLLEEDEDRRVSEAHSAKIESPEDLVRHYRDRIHLLNAGAWRNLAERHGLQPKEVIAVAERSAKQTTLPRPKAAPIVRATFGKATRAAESQPGGSAQ